jgi:hypothetical protein
MIWIIGTRNIFSIYLDLKKSGREKARAESAFLEDFVAFLSSNMLHGLLKEGLNHCCGRGCGISRAAAEGLETYSQRMQYRSSRKHKYNLVRSIVSFQQQGA